MRADSQQRLREWREAFGDAATKFGKFPPGESKSVWLGRHGYRLPTAGEWPLAVVGKAREASADISHLTLAPLHQRAILVPLYPPPSANEADEWRTAHWPRKTELRPSKGMLEARPGRSSAKLRGGARSSPPSGREWFHLERNH